MGKNQHVVKRDNGWAVRGEKNSKDTKVLQTKSEAVKCAKDIAKNQKSELFIHDKNGRIRERNSYGNDPYTSRG